MIDSKYFIKCKLGAGGSSDVFYVVDQNDSKFAVKIMRKPNNSLDGWHISTLQKEYFIMEMLSLHPNVLKCVESVCDGELEHNGHKFTISYNITEYACNGALSSYIHRTGCFDEAVGRFYIKQLVSAVAFMHEYRVAHMDIKPQNIVFDSNFNLKLMDFGTAECINDSSSKVSTRSGTEGFMAPEVADLSIRTEFDAYKADVYSLGVTMLLILFGRKPDFGWWETSSTEDSNCSKKYWSEPWHYQKDIWCQDNNEAIDLILLMLNANSENRLSIFSTMNRCWLNDSSLDISFDKVFMEMIMRKDFAFPPHSKFNFE